MREEYSDRKLLLGTALRPQNIASPSSATSAITWLLRSMDQSLSASEVRSACSAGIMREPGSFALFARPSRLKRIISGMNRNRPPSLVVNSPVLRAKLRTSATASVVGVTPTGRSSSRRRGKGAKPSAARISRTARAKRRSLFFERMAYVVDRVIALAQRDDNIVELGLLGLLLRSGPLHGEEIGQLTAAKIVAEHPERSRSIAKPPRNLWRGKPFDEIRP